jgi:hypothetical protein
MGAVVALTVLLKRFDFFLVGWPRAWQLVDSRYEVESSTRTARIRECMDAIGTA